MATKKTTTTDGRVTDEQAARVAEGTFVLNLRMGYIRQRANVKRDTVEKMATAIAVKNPETVEEMAADGADEIHVSKELLKVEEIKLLVREIVSTRSLVRGSALPTRFLRSGMYLFPATRIEWVEGLLKGAQTRIDDLFAALEPKWESILRAEEKRLKPLGLFDARDYPALSAIREAAQVRYVWLRFEVPTALKGISPAMFAAERAKAMEMWREAFEQIRLAHRETLLGFVEKIRAALAPGEDGRRRVIRQATLDNLMEFLNTYRLQDVTDDKELAELIDRAKSALRGVDAEVLRTEERAAERIGQTISEIGDALAPLVVAQTRRVQLKD